MKWFDFICERNFDCMMASENPKMKDFYHYAVDGTSICCSGSSLNHKKDTNNNSNFEFDLHKIKKERAQTHSLSRRVVTDSRANSDFAIHRIKITARKTPMRQNLLLLIRKKNLGKAA